MSTIDINFTPNKGIYIKCLRTPRMDTLAKTIYNEGGFSYFVEELNRLLIFEMQLGKFNELEVSGTNDAWLCFKNLHEEKTIEKITGAMKDALIDIQVESIELMLTVTGDIVYTNVESSKVSDLNDAQGWTWIDHTNDLRLAKAMRYLSDKQSMIIYAGSNTYQVWGDFRYNILYFAAPRYALLSKFTNLEHDFWIEVARKFPITYSEAKAYASWTPNTSLLDTLQEIKEL